MSDTDNNKPSPGELPVVKHNWGSEQEDHFGYESDQERLDKRGLEDWELVDKIPESQKRIPYWFIGVVIVVLLVAIGLSFPFWGDRPGYERSWFNWGFVAALVYIAIFGTFVYFMVNLYGSNLGGKLDSDQSTESDDPGSHEIPENKQDPKRETIGKEYAEKRDQHR